MQASRAYRTGLDVQRAEPGIWIGWDLAMGERAAAAQRLGREQPPRGDVAVAALLKPVDEAPILVRRQCVPCRVQCRNRRSKSHPDFSDFSDDVSSMSAWQESHGVSRGGVSPSPRLPVSPVSLSGHSKGRTNSSAPSVREQSRNCMFFACFLGVFWGIFGAVPARCVLSLAPLCRYPTNTHPNPLQNPLGVWGRITCNAVIGVKFAGLIGQIYGGVYQACMGGGYQACMGGRGRCVCLL